MAEEIFEGYTDGFEVSSNPYGMSINFKLAPARAGGEQTVVSIMRMSWEMGKVLAYMALRHIKQREAEMGISHPVPTEILNQLRIPKEDWDAAWTPPEKGLEGM